MSPDLVVRICLSDELDPRDRTAIRALLDTAFAGDFSDQDWDNALGGTHALIETADVEAVAVLPARQGTGLGTAVMRALGEIVARDFALGALSTGEWHFYERLGWERWRGPTWVRYPDGRRERTPDDDDSLMILRTPRTPALDPSAPLTCDARPGDVW